MNRSPAIRSILAVALLQAFTVLPVLGSCAGMVGCMGFDCDCPTHRMGDHGAPQTTTAGSEMHHMHQHGSDGPMARSGEMHIGAGCTEKAAAPSLVSALPPEGPASLVLDALPSSPALPILAAVLQPDALPVESPPQADRASRYLLFASLLL